MREVTRSLQAPHLPLVVAKKANNEGVESCIAWIAMLALSGAILLIAGGTMLAIGKRTGKVALQTAGLGRLIAGGVLLGIPVFGAGVLAVAISSGAIK